MAEAETERLIALRVPAALDKKLEELAKKLKRSKSDLIREAIQTLIGMHRDAGTI